ncbi:hypothetical protein DPMN_121695 [Dreissena polymorpha]|uniref:Uncharacterized protein n=1 Tax=Dreissena polymorpha TaxID=45954 RepID=A0A9D4JPS8_DREPO|nr:hypothetical protein DPMN_121695 [Dreissena polymorpha]
MYTCRKYPFKRYYNYNRNKTFTNLRFHIQRADTSSGVISILFLHDLALKVHVARVYRMSPRVYMFVSSGYLRMPNESVVLTNWKC